MIKIKTTKVFEEIEKGINNKKTIISVQGGTRSGKTYNILIWLICYMLKNPKQRLTIVRGTLPALRNSALRDFKDILQEMELYDEKSFNKSELVYVLPNGSMITFISTDSEQKLRGLKSDVIFCNEANEISPIEWQQLKLRTGSFAIIYIVIW